MPPRQLILSLRHPKRKKKNQGTEKVSRIYSDAEWLGSDANPKLQDRARRGRTRAEARRAEAERAGKTQGARPQEKGRCREANKMTKSISLLNSWLLFQA